MRNGRTRDSDQGGAPEGAGTALLPARVNPLSPEATPAQTHLVGTTAVSSLASARTGFAIRRAGPLLAVLAAGAAAAVAGYLEYRARFDWSFVVTLATALFLSGGILLIAQHRRGDGVLA